MYKKMKEDRRGFTLVELIVVIAILAVLAAVLVPQYVQYIEKAREAKVKQEAGEFNRAAQVALVDAMANEGTNGAQIGFNQAKVADSNVEALYKGTTFTNTTICGRITNWWFKKGDTYKTNLEANPGRANHDYVLLIVKILNLSADSNKSSLDVSDTVPSKSILSKPSTGKVIFQVLFKPNGSVVTEYYRDNYFVRIEGNSIVSIKVAGAQISTKLNNQNVSLFTSCDTSQNGYK